MKKKNFLELRLSEAAELIKNIAADEKIRKELSTFIDKVGKSSTTLIKEVLTTLSNNAAEALNDALDKKVDDVKQIVEGGDANVIETTNDGPDSGRKDK